MIGVPYEKTQCQYQVNMDGRIHGGCGADVFCVFYGNAYCDQGSGSKFAASQRRYDQLLAENIRRPLAPCAGI